MNLRLIELDPSWRRYEEEGGHVYMRAVSSIDEAHGVEFLCPLCFLANKGPVGTHIVICWSSSRGTPAHAHPLPGRWKMEGTSFEDLTLNGEEGKSRSVLLTGKGCGWHGFITNGWMNQSGAQE